MNNELDSDRVTKRFYADFKQEHLHFIASITGIDDEQEQTWYASVLLYRLMFIYFLQYTCRLDNGNMHYLEEKLVAARECSQSNYSYYSEFLTPLFFEGFAKPEAERSDAAKNVLGKIDYLNAELFLLHPIEKRWTAIQIPDQAFKHILTLFSRYSWNLDDTPSGLENEISPHMLSYIFEKYANQKSFGAYYTRPEITTYLCKQTIHTFILAKINTPTISQTPRSRQFATLEALLTNLDARLCRNLLFLLPEISLLDPACGSGAFLLSAMHTLMHIYEAIIAKIAHVHDEYLTNWLYNACTNHCSIHYFLKKKIISENLFGVDMMEDATKIAKMRLFLSLISSIPSTAQLEPLPNIDSTIRQGNALIGFLHVDLPSLRDPFHDTLELHKRLLTEFTQLGVKYEQTTWDYAKQKEGKTKKRTLTISDIAALYPFHWGYEFDRIMNKQGGFDIVITNPPWEALKPQGKEFFAAHSQHKMHKSERSQLLQDSDLCAAWLAYQDCFPYQSLYFRSTPQYKNQISLVNGKKCGTDINLYKLFTEQCYNLLKPGGICGIVVPSGIYTDLGAKQLRAMLFNETQITGLFGFENRKMLFEGIDCRFKFVALTFKKGGQTHIFPAAFMRQDVADLECFPAHGALHISTELISHLSPDSLSIMEFKHDIDIRNAEKMLKVPLLHNHSSSDIPPLPRFIVPVSPSKWNITLTNEFHMTNHRYLFSASPAACAHWPLYEGKLIHQFTHTFSKPRYWINAEQGKDVLLRQELRRVEMALDAIAILQSEFKHLATRQERVTAFLKMLGYPPLALQDVCIAPDAARLAVRDIARNTDERTLIAAILPPAVFAGNTLNYLVPWHFNAEKIFRLPSHVKECYEPTLSAHTLAYLCGILNSFVLDYFLRFKVTTHVNMFYLYQLPIPRLAPDDPLCIAIASRVGQLVCTGPEFDALRYSLFSDTHKNVLIDPAERQKIRCEIDALVAHLYAFTEDELLHILHTFPLVEQSLKDDIMAAYRRLAPLD